MARKHGESGTRLHTIWKGMTKRCRTPSATGYKSYGGRGITVCEQWLDYVTFRDWAMANGYADDRQIDRVHANGNYEPGNCRWIVQAVNVGRLWRVPDQIISGRLSEEIIANAPKKTRAYKLTDGRGLYVYIGTLYARSFRYKFRIGGKEKLLVIGQYPTISLAEARELCAIARDRVNRGLDPTKVKSDSKARKSRRRRAQLPQ